MPKDDSRPHQNGEASTAPPTRAPLKRGDACLYCRKRRIKCDAAKPSCGHCTKLKRECQYDTGKPVSRVKHLEEKVAELEELLKQGDTSTNANKDQSSGRSSFSQVPPPNNNGDRPGMPPSSSSGEYDFGAGILDVNMINQLGNNGWNPVNTPPPIVFGTALLGGGGGNSRNGYMPANNNGQESFDFNMLDPSYMNLVNSLGNTSTGPTDFATVPPQVQPQPNIPPSQPASTQPIIDSSLFPSFGIEEMDFTIDVNGSTGLTPFLNMPSSPPDPSREASQFSSRGSGSGSNPLPSQANSSNSNPFSAFVTDTPEYDGMTSTQVNGTAYPKEAMVGDVLSNIIGVKDDSPFELPRTDSVEAQIQSELNQTNGGGGGPELEGLPMVGGWFDAADLPHVARNHLLDQFFSTLPLFGQQFHIPRFFASLTLPPSKRPHPCLLYSMYLLASHLSQAPSIKSLRPHFYSIAMRQLEESIAKADRLLDATRAATMLAVYQFSLGRYHEGWMMTGQASRLAISCGLHQIGSSVFRVSNLPEDHRADLIGLMRQRQYVLPPPKDPIELGERIWAFWSIYMADRTGAIASQHPVCMADKDIVTPFPKPLYEYEVGLVSEADDISISSIYSPIHRPLAHYAESTSLIIRIRAITILERASKLMYEPPEAGWDRNLNIRSSSQSFSNGNSNGTSPYNQSNKSPDYPIDQYLENQNTHLGAGVPESGYPQFPGYGLSSGGQQFVDSQAQAPTQTPGSNSGSGSHGIGWTKCAKIRNPKAYGEVREALERIERDLPPDRRVNWEIYDGQIGLWHYGKGNNQAAVQHFVLGCAWMFLFDVYAWNCENTLAVNVARRITQTIRIVIAQETTYNEMDVFVAMIWSFTSKILIREEKRLMACGQRAAAAVIGKDIDLILLGLRKLGLNYQLSTMQAYRVDRYRKSTANDTEFMNEGEDDESDVRYNGQCDM